MSDWRRRALEFFPDIRTAIEPGDATIHTVLFELLPRCRLAHDRCDLNELAKIYGFVEWCFRQRAKDLRNAAAVAFYEHLGDSRVTSSAMPQWVRPDIFENIRPLIAARMEPSDFEELCKGYGSRFEPVSHAGVGDKPRTCLARHPRLTGVRTKK